VAVPLKGEPVEGGTPQEELLVLAASSLTNVLSELGAEWKAAGGPKVRFSFDATSRLAAQALRGAPADLIIAADREWIRWLAARGGVAEGSERDLFGNELVLVVPAGRPVPSGPEALGALDRIALAGENVPAGRYAREVLEWAGAWEAIQGRLVRGGSVRGTLEWVARREVDAGIVYRTDAIAEPDVTVAFVFPEGSHRAVRYTAAVLEGSAQGADARAFLDFVQGPAGSAVVGRAGFPLGRVGATEAEAVPDAALPSVSSAIRISLIVALLAALAGLPVAVGVGWLLARRDFPGKAVVSTVTLAPLVVPPVVTGFLLLSVFGSQSPVGRWLTAVGVPVPFTLVGATVAALVVGFPLYVLSVRTAFESVDAHYEELSWTLGVPPRATFLRVSLPLALPGIAAGALLAFARALGEFGATVVLAGNVEGTTQTIALAVYTLLEAPEGQRTTWVLVGASVALSLAALVGYEALSRRQRRKLEVRGG
jgi:molybdate transport system permease protein